MKKAMLVIFLIISIILNGYFYVKSNKNERVVKNYYLNCVGQAQYHIANVDLMINNLRADGILDKEYEKYYMIAGEFKELSAEISLFNIYYSSIEKSKTIYFGRIDTSRIFDFYNIMLESWAYEMKKNNVKEMPTKAEIQAFKEDVKNLAKIFQVYINVNYKDEEKIESMNYERLYNRLKKFANSSKLEEIRIRAKETFNH